MVQETVNKPENVQATPNLTPAQEALQALWEKHVGYELVLTALKMLSLRWLRRLRESRSGHDWGVGKAAVGEFYSKYFIPQIPPDFELVPISRTIGLINSSMKWWLRLILSDGLDATGVAPGNGLKCRWSRLFGFVTASP